MCQVCYRNLIIIQCVLTWSSDKSIGDVISDNQDNINYVGEDQTYHCTLVRSDGKTGDVIGVKAQLVQ